MKFLREFESKIKYDEYIAMSGNPWPTISTFEYNGSRVVDIDEELKDADAIFEHNASGIYLGGHGKADRQVSIRRDTKSIFGNDRHYPIDFTLVASGGTMPASKFGIWEQYSFYDRLSDRFAKNLIAYKFNPVSGVRKFPDFFMGWYFYNINHFKIREGITRIGQHALRENSTTFSMIFPDSMTTFDAYVCSYTKPSNGKSIVIGEGAKSLTTYAFSHNRYGQCYFICKAKTPPTGASNIFYRASMYTGASEEYKYIYVPKESITKYETTSNVFTPYVGEGKLFSGFKSIEEDLPPNAEIEQTWMPDGALPLK